MNESDWDRIRYQHPEMVDTLLKDLQKAGDVTIVRDKPEQHLYVVVCENRIEPELNEIYRQEFQGTTGRPVTGMWQHQFAQQQRSYREKALKLQRQSAGMLDEAGKPAYTFSDDFRKSFTARGTDGE